MCAEENNISTFITVQMKSNSPEKKARPRVLKWGGGTLHYCCFSFSRHILWVSNVAFWRVYFRHSFCRFSFSFIFILFYFYFECLFAPPSNNFGFIGLPRFYAKRLSFCFARHQINAKTCERYYFGASNWIIVANAPNESEWMNVKKQAKRKV